MLRLVTRLDRAIAVLLVVFAGTGCSARDPISPAPREGLTASAPTEPHQVSGGRLRGTVYGVHADRSIGPLEGARVDAYRLVAIDPSPSPDSLLYPKELWGSGVTAADGAFEFLAVPEGTYLLDAFPPAGTSYGAGQASAVVAEGSDDQVLTIYLYETVPIPPPPPPPPPPPDSLGTAAP